MLEQRAFLLKNASVAKDGSTIAGLAAAFGEPSLYGDEIVPGAFAATLAAHAKRGSAPAMLAGHNPDWPIGRWTKLQETPEGLIVEGKISDATEKARETRQLVAEGVLDGLSIGFLPKASKREGERRLISEAELAEISIVSTPAIPSARVREVRSCNSVGEFEDALRDVFGLSRRKAHAAASKAWHVIGGDDGDEEEIRAALQRIEAATAKLKPRR